MHGDHDGDCNGGDCDYDVEMVGELRRIALQEALRAGLCQDDADDCAMDMVLRAVLQCAAQATQGDAATPAPVTVSRLLLRADLPPEQKAFWLRRCARNFASKWRRSLLCRKCHEAACVDLGVSAETLSLFPSTSHAPSAEDVAFTHLLRRDVYAACGQLPPNSRTLFEQFHLHDDTMAEIAFSAGRSEGAVKQSVYRTRARVRTSLATCGHDPVRK